MDDALLQYRFVVNIAEKLQSIAICNTVCQQSVFFKTGHIPPSEGNPVTSKNLSSWEKKKKKKTQDFAHNDWSYL